MKKNNRASRPWDLRINQTRPVEGSTLAVPSYQSAENLVAWWTFSEGDIGKTFFTDMSGQRSGSFVTGVTPKRPSGSHFESPAFLKGEQFLRRQSVTISDRDPSNKIEGFEVSNLPDISLAGFTVSMTFKFLQNYSQPIGAGRGDDGVIELLSITEAGKPTGRFGFFYDNDGNTIHSLGVVAAGTGGSRRWNANPGPGGTGPFVSGVDELRGWCRLDVVINSVFSAFVGDADYPNYGFPGGLAGGMSVYFNGEPVYFDDSVVSGGPSFAGITNLRRVVFGQLTSAFSSLGGNNRIKLGECAIWSSALDAKEIQFLHRRNTTAEGSGILSNPARLGEFCGECSHDEYPTITRTGDRRRLGRRTPHFDDVEQNMVPPVGTTINYPTLLASGAQADGSEGSIIATPNELPDIYITQKALGIQGRANVITNYERCGNSRNSSDSYAPFNDTQAPVNLKSRTPFLNSVAPGFSRDVGDRIIIDIDITPTSAKVLQVITGSGGNTFGSGDVVSSQEKTGLAYFNFVNGNFESIGGIKSETGTRVNWCLPGELSSSAVFDYIDQDGRKTATDNPQLPGSWAEDGNPRIFQASNSPFYEDFSKVPRIFQPYSSIIAHRSTFNHVFSTEFDSFAFFGNRRYAVTSSDNYNKLWKKFSEVGLDSGGQFWFGDGLGTSDQYALGYGGVVADQENDSAGKPFCAFSNDMKGRGWQRAFFEEYSGRQDIDRTGDGGPIWSNVDPPTPWLESLRPGYIRTFGSMGRPVAYTNWCRNNNFHASSSQTLLMSNYINSPMVLESFDIKASVLATRLQDPKSGSVQSGGNNENAPFGDPKKASPLDAYYAYPRPEAAAYEMTWWSNTNNHIDMLTFFLMKQTNSYRNAPAATDRQDNSSRELISFSNHIFASPYVGWDWANRIHLAHDYIQSAFLGGGWPNAQNNILPWGNASPAGGARVTRLFKVEEDILRQNVPGIDSFSYYKTKDGMIQGPTGSDGVFFNWAMATGADSEWLNLTNGVPGLMTEITANKPGSSVENWFHPHRRFVSASVDIEVNVPIRTQGSYMQRQTTVLPSVQTTCPQNTNTPENSYFNLDVKQGSSPVGVDQSTRRKIPRPALPVIGTYWPGGPATSRALRPPPTALQAFSASYLDGNVDDDWTLSFSTRQYLSTGSTNQKFKMDRDATMLVDTYESPVRTIRAHSGTVIFDAQQIGGENIGGSKPGEWDGTKWNATFLRGPIAAQLGTDLNSPNTRQDPGYLGLQFSGSDIAQNTGYVLFPDDEIVFGVQWSPADAVHRSMRSIKRAAKAVKFMGVTKGVGVLTGTLPGPQYKHENFGPYRPSAGTDQYEGLNGTFTADLLNSANPGNIYSPGSANSAVELASQYYRYSGYCETNDLEMMASASCEILQKPMTLRLYGTLLRDQKQKHSSLPQQLTTNCVHEVIGNEPVLDQFDLRTFEEIKTSTGAKQISGSMNLGAWYANASSTKLAVGDFNSYKTLGRGVRRSLANENLEDVFAVKRSKRCIDISEYYYDSLAPNLKDCWNIDNATFGWTSTDLGDYALISLQLVNTRLTSSFGGALAVGDLSGNTLRSSTDQDGLPVAPNRRWCRSFPFEPRYASVDRMFNQNVGLAGYIFSGSGASGTAAPPPLMYSSSFNGGTLAGTGTRNVGFAVVDADQDPAAPGSYYRNWRGPYYNIDATTTKTFVVSPAVERVQSDRAMQTTSASRLASDDRSVRSDFLVGTQASAGAKATNHIRQNFELSGSKKNTMDGYLGVGDNRFGVLDHYYYYVESQSGDEVSAGRAESAFAHRLLARKPRGYRYGMISSVPKRLSASWRVDRFGQFRDMLEQRQYSSLYITDPPDVALSRIEDGLQVRQNARRPGAVSCTFRSAAFENPTAPAQTVAVRPVETNSCNLSTEMTSSIPFFDGELKNRDSAPSTDDEVIVI